MVRVAAGGGGGSAGVPNRVPFAGSDFRITDVTGPSISVPPSDTFVVPAFEAHTRAPRAVGGWFTRDPGSELGCDYERRMRRSRSRRKRRRRRRE